MKNPSGRNSSFVFSGLRQYPPNTFGPRTSITPISSAPKAVPVAGSAIRNSTPGSGNPTVPAMRSPS